MAVSVRATAKITLEIEMDELGRWGESCAFDQIEKQATEAVMDRLNNSDWVGFKLSAKPIITAIMVRK